MMDIDAPKLDELLCDLYAYVDDHRCSIERDWDDDISDDDRRIAHIENELNDRIFHHLTELRRACGAPTNRPMF